MMTRATLNNAIWTVSLLLQAGLIARLFRRGMTWRIPSFTLLLIFYVVRSAGLFFFASRLARPLYIVVANDLALLDLFLQLAVGMELELRLLPIPGGAAPAKTLRRLGLLLLLPALAIVATILLSASVPAKVFVPTDRLQMFDSLFLILLGFWAISRPYADLLRRVSLGFAAYGIVAVASIIGRTLAAAHRNVEQFLGWTYAASIALLLVTAFWFFTLKPDPLENFARDDQGSSPEGA